MNLDPTSLMVSMIFSSIGVGFFIYGKKQHKFVPLGVGIALSVYTYFISDITLTIVIGIVLMAIPWLVSRLMGY